VAENLCNIEWCCVHCGSHGTAAVWVDLCDSGKIAELVRSHSLMASRCDGDARMTLRIRRPFDSDSDWEQTNDLAKRRAAKRRQLWGEETDVLS
jgi:hypothetical protein